MVVNFAAVPILCRHYTASFIIFLRLANSSSSSLVGIFSIFLMLCFLIIVSITNCVCRFISFSMLFIFASHKPARHSSRIPVLRLSNHIHDNPALPDTRIQAGGACALPWPLKPRLAPPGLCRWGYRVRGLCRCSGGFYNPCTWPHIQGCNCCA